MYQLQLRILENNSTELGASVLLESNNLMDLVSATAETVAKMCAPTYAIVDVAWRRVEFIGSSEECDNYQKAHPEKFMQTGSRNFITVLMP